MALKGAMMGGFDHPLLNNAIHGGFHKWGVLPNGWFIRDNPIKMDNLGVPLI